MKSEIVVSIIILCIFITFGATYGAFNVIKDQEINNLNIQINDLTNELSYCQDVSDEWHLVGSWTIFESILMGSSIPITYDFFSNRTFVAYYGIDYFYSTSFKNGTYQIIDSKLILTVNEIPSMHNYSFDVDAEHLNVYSLVIIDGRLYFK